MSQSSEVADNLTVMDDKLRELQHELSVLATAPEAAPEVSHVPLAAAAADQARAIIASAQEEAARIVVEAGRRVSAITTQIDDLQRLRDGLERSARALVDEYAAALSNIGAAAPAPTAPKDESPPSRVHPPLW